MSEAPPQLADIPQYSEMNIPTLSSGADQNQSAAVSTSNGSNIVQDTKESIYTSEVSLRSLLPLANVADNTSTSTRQSSRDALSDRLIPLL